MGAAAPPAWAAVVVLCSVVAAASTAGRASAFTVTPRRFGGRAVVAAGATPASSRHRAPRPSFAPALSLASSSSDGDGESGGKSADDGKNTIVIALTAAEGTNDDLKAALSAHPVVGMMGVTLDVREMPCVVVGAGAAAAASSGDDEVKGEEVKGEEEQGEDDDGQESESEKESEKEEAEETIPAPAAVVDFSQEQLDAIDDIDLACFGSADAVISWLHNVDVARGFTDTEDDEVLDDDEMNDDGNGGVMAACATQELYNECLGSGRWEERKIYYPAKKEEDESLTWADSAAMAIGDVMERKFWGGGW